MHYGEIKYPDIANGTGVRVSLFVSGCTHHCKGCFQPETWNFDYGKEFDAEAEQAILDKLNSPYVEGLTILGGEPFEPENSAVLAPFARHVRALFPDKDIWAYTGYTVENMPRESLNLLSFIDILVDGEFVEELKDITLKFRGSSNQRIISVPEYLKHQTVKLIHFN